MTRYFARKFATYVLAFWFGGDDRLADTAPDAG